MYMYMYIYIYVYVYSYLENPSFSDMPKIMLLVRYPIISHQIYTIPNIYPIWWVTCLFFNINHQSSISLPLNIQQIFKHT